MLKGGGNRCRRFMRIYKKLPVLWFLSNFLPKFWAQFGFLSLFSLSSPTLPGFRAMSSSCDRSSLEHLDDFARFLRGTPLTTGSYASWGLTFADLESPQRHEEVLKLSRSRPKNAAGVQAKAFCQFLLGVQSLHAAFPDWRPGPGKGSYPSRAGSSTVLPASRWSLLPVLATVPPEPAAPPPADAGSWSDLSVTFSHSLHKFVTFVLCD